MDTNLTWNTVGDGYESDDWHWEIVPGRDPNLYDVRDLCEREWVAFDLPLDKAKAYCEAVHADDLAAMRAALTPADMDTLRSGDEVAVRSLIRRLA